ncbi:DotG/IcmE/VirB10 family protein [Pseudoalteromonas prydzensis]|uniref:DotG/IcmE/VirB10 family protein n=1 Tax=Pseudoalteromonas prydzensis TaxID=182141 RepID=UPI003FD11715
MSIIKNAKAYIPKYNPDIKLFSPENRSFLMVATIITVFVLCILLWFFVGNNEVKRKEIALENINITVEKATADAKVTPQYEKSIKELNAENYNKASKKLAGATLPIVYHNKPDTDVGSIEGCGCTFDDNAKQALIEELRKLGITSINKTDGLRLGKSDIYVQTDGLLIDERGNAYLWDGERVKTNDKGLIQYEKSSMPISIDNGQSIYLSNEGKFYNEATAIVRLMGRLLSAEGVIIIGNGLKANRPGGMTQVSNSDIYITADSQLATMDAKPVYHSSKFVFKDLESRLHNSYNEDINWEDKSVFQQGSGAITDRANRKFNRIGILISHGGIIIDNDSMLTEPLKNIKRYADSDLFVNNEDYLVDSYAENNTYKGYDIKVGVNDSLVSEIGPVINSANLPLYLKSTGRFYADKPVYLTGTVKNSLGIAYDRFGHLISRSGKLTQLGSSAIWHTSDRYLAAENGQSLNYQNKDVFQDITRFKIINGYDAYGLKSLDGEVITDIIDKEVYLNSNGELVYPDGSLVKESGLLTTADGVVISSKGHLIVGDSSFVPVTDANGNQLYYNGSKVVKGIDNRLYDENGNVILTKDGRALFLNDSGTIVDENGNIVTEPLLSAMESIASNKGFKTDPTSGGVVDSNGNALFFQGKRVRKGADGRLYDEIGQLLVDSDGQPLSINSNGEIVDGKGSAISLRDFQIETPQDTFVDLGNKELTVKPDGTVLDSAGNELYYNGSKVRQGKDGLLYDEAGTVITDDAGNPLSINSRGEIIKSNGDLASTNGFQVLSKQKKLTPLGNSDFNVSAAGEVLDSNGNHLFYRGKKVMRGKNGELYDKDGNILKDENGQTLSINGNGEIVNVSGDPISLKKFKVSKPLKKIASIGNSGFGINDEGHLRDQSGNTVYYKGKKVIPGVDGKLYDEEGNLVTGSKGQPLSINKNGEIVNEDGTKVELDDFQIAKPITSISSVKDNGGFTVNELGKVLDRDGNALLYQGKSVTRGADGFLYDDKGVLITDELGQPLSLNANGEIVSPKGKLASTKNFKIAKELTQQKPLKKNGNLKVKANGSVIDSAGNELLYKGKKVFRGADGRLYDNEGNLLTDDRGQALALNSAGEIITADGRLMATDDFLIEKPLTRLTALGNGGFSTTPSEYLIDSNGNELLYNGRRVKRGDDGLLYDESGNLIRNERGSPLSLNSAGEIIDDSGLPISLKGFSSNEIQTKLVPVNRNSKFTTTADGRVVDQSGNQLLYKGKKVIRGVDGKLYDQNGNLLKDDSGKSLSLNNNGKIVNSDGKVIDTSEFMIKEPVKVLSDVSNGGFVRNQDGSVSDGFGNPLTYKGKQVIQGKDGKLYDLSGQLLKTQQGEPLMLNSNGEIVTLNGKTTDLDDFKVEKLATDLTYLSGNKGLTADRNGNVLDSEGNQVYYQGKKVVHGPDGKLYDEQGQLITDDAGQPLMLNEEGVIVTSNGKPASVQDFQVNKLSSISRNSGLNVDRNGNVLDSEGNQVYYQGKKVVRGPDGKLYDEQGQLITDDAGQPLMLNEEGVIVTSNGKPASVQDFQVNKLSSISRNSGLNVDRNGNVLDSEGNQVYYQGKKVVRGPDGKLYDEQGQLITDDAGQPLMLNEEGVIVTSNGKPASVQDFQVNKLSSISRNSGLNVDRNGNVLDSEGNQVYYQGKKVVRGPDGKLYDEQGQLITDDAGQPLMLNEEGVIVTSNGKPASVQDFQVNKLSSISRNSGLNVDRNGNVLDSEGNQVYYQGKKVVRGPDGKLYDEQGQLISDDAGQPLMLNEEGVIVTSSGKPALIEGFTSSRSAEKLIPLGNNGYIANAQGEVFNSAGRPLYYKGKKVIRGAGGKLFDEDGKILTDSNGQPLKLDQNGLIVNAKGEPVELGGFQTKQSNKVKVPAGKFDSFTTSPSGEVLDENGNQLYFSGKKVIRGNDGNLYDSAGNLLKDRSGNPLKLNRDGKIVNSKGDLVTLGGFELSKNATKRTPLDSNTGLKVGKNNIVVDGNGNPILYKGTKLFKGANGQLYDEKGNLIRTDSGKPLTLNEQGQVVDINGQPVPINDLEAEVPLTELSPVGNAKFIRNSSGEVMTVDGTPLYFKGKKVIQGRDGKLYDEDGTLLTDEASQPLSLNKNGQIVNSEGQQVSMTDFQVEGRVPSNNLKTSNTSTLNGLGDTGIFTTDDGLLIDKEGKPITYKGKRVRRGLNGQLFDGDGQAILDSLGNPLYMNELGEVIDVNGEKVEGVHFQNGQGQYIAKDGNAPLIKRVADSDIHLTRDGLVTDEQGRPMLFKGKPVKVGAGGRLVTTEGEYVTDATGNSIFLTNSGELKNREEQLAKGAVLLDADGVTIDPKGKRVSNGGKLTDLGNGLFKTAEGLLVDRLGKPVLIDGKQAFIDDEGAIVDANSRNIRYKGRRLNLSNTGALIDVQGNPIKDDGLAVSITNKGLTKEDGTLVLTPNEQFKEVNTTANSKIREQFTDNAADTSTSKFTPDDAKTVTTTSYPKTVNTTASADTNTLASLIDINSLTPEEITRLNQRYDKIYRGLEQKLSQYEGDMRKKPNYSTAVFSSGTSNGEAATQSINGSNKSAIANPSNTKLGRELLKIKAGTVLYAANTMKVNTDLETKVVFDIMGLPHTHPFYRSTAQGVVSLKYDNIVIQFKSICPEFGECYPLDAIAVDPATKTASISGEIDKHYWYRFGGLALATLTQGAAVAMGESRDRTEEYDEQGKVVTYSGLDGTELLIRSVEPLGGALANVFMENVNRPYTGFVADGEEVGIFLFEDVVLREKVN